MNLYYGVPSEIDEWMALVTETRDNFPGLETREALDDHRATVLKFMGKRQAVCVKEDNRIIGVMLFSRGHNMICYLVVHPEYRGLGVASMMMDEALRRLDQTKEITVSTFTAEDKKGPAPRALYEKYGFIEDALTVEFDYPNQVYVLHPEGAERKERQLSVNRMTREIARILSENKPSVYLYGFSCLNDFRPGWSDLDLLVLTESRITDEQARELLYLRQALLSKEPGNPYYRSFEGGMLTLNAFLTGEHDRVVYWGTSGERITEHYAFDSFCNKELIQSGIHLYGKEIRNQLAAPSFDDLLADLTRHCDTVKKHARDTGRSLYSFGWMLDVSRCLYTLRTGEIISKTAAAEWALKNGLCPDPADLEYALKVRREPLMYKNNSSALDRAGNLCGSVLRFADVLEKALQKHTSGNG